MSKSKRDRVTGTVYRINWHNSNDLVNVGFGDLYVKIPAVEETTDEDGWYFAHGAAKVEAWLRGLYCWVENQSRMDKSHPQMRYVGVPTFDWNESLDFKTGIKDRRLRDLMAYYYVTLARQQFGELLSESVIEILDSDDWLVEMLVNVDETGRFAKKAMWDRGLLRIRFGKDRRFVLDSLIIFHEYAHAIIDLITGKPYFPSGKKESASDTEKLAAATCEAYADYLACSLRDYPKILEGTPIIRDLEASIEFEPERKRNINYDSMSLSTGLWELRGTLGRAIVDELVVQSLFALRDSRGKIETFGLMDAALAAIDVDEESNSSANAAAIENVFIQRNIL